MNKTIITIIMVIAVIGGLLWWGKSIQKSPTAGADTGKKSALITSEKIYDFGTISMKNGDVTKEFTVTNSSAEDMFFPLLETSCMCTKAFMVGLDGTTKGPFGMPGMGYVPSLNETIKAGESRVIRVVYDPNAHGPAGVGQINRFVTLTDKSGGKLQLEIKALVTP